MKLIPIPKEKYEDYRLSLMFDCYKWDPQYLDHNTVAPYVLAISPEEHKELVSLIEAIDKETTEAEEYLNLHQELTKPLALPRRIRKEIHKLTNYERDKHVRLKRYDFHPTVEGKWAVSEVNSDVPGGYAEGSFMPKLALETIGQEDKYWCMNFGENLVNAISSKVKAGGRIMLVHCTSYSDDRQVMQFLGDRLKEKGFHVIYGAADHVKFENGKAYSTLDGNEGELDMVYRYTPLEWMIEMRRKFYKDYYGATVPTCNHPIAMYAQTKRFPLVWDELEKAGISMATWRALLPETLEVKDAKGKEGYIYKPACGRVGDGISIKEACIGNEYKEIMKDVRRHPKKFLAQKRFFVEPLEGENGEKYNVCLGCYTVDGKHAGYYARISKSARIDSGAADTPVIIERGTDNDR